MRAGQEWLPRGCYNSLWRWGCCQELYLLLRGHSRSQTVAKILFLRGRANGPRAAVISSSKGEADPWKNLERGVCTHTKNCISIINAFWCRCFRSLCSFSLWPSSCPELLFLWQCSPPCHSLLSCPGPYSESASNGWTGTKIREVLLLQIMNLKDDFAPCSSYLYIKVFIFVLLGCFMFFFCFYCLPWLYSLWL